MQNESKTKRCPRCGRELSLDHFGKNSSKPDGLNNYCRECSSEVQKEWRERKKRREKEISSTVENFLAGKEAPKEEPKTPTPPPVKFEKQELLARLTARELMTQLTKLGFKGRLNKPLTALYNTASVDNALEYLANIPADAFDLSITIEYKQDQTIDINNF